MNIQQLDEELENAGMIIKAQELYDELMELIRGVPPTKDAQLMLASYCLHNFIEEMKSK